MAQFKLPRWAKAQTLFPGCRHLHFHYCLFQAILYAYPNLLAQLGLIFIYWIFSWSLILKLSFYHSVYFCHDLLFFYLPSLSYYSCCFKFPLSQGFYKSQPILQEFNFLGTPTPSRYYSPPQAIFFRAGQLCYPYLEALTISNRSSMRTGAIFSLLPRLKQLDPSTFGHQFGNLIDELPLKYPDLSRIIFELLFFDFIDFFRNWFQFQNLSDSPAYKNRPHELLEPVKHRQEQFIILPLLIATEFRLDQDCAMINEHKHGWLYLFVVFDKPQSIALMLPYLRKQEPGQSGQKTRSLIIRMATKVSSVRSGMGFCVVPIFK